MFYRILPGTLEQIKKQFILCTEVSEQDFEIPKQSEGLKYRYTLEDRNKNLVQEVAGRHLEEFRAGSDVVPELGYLASSYAMLFNIFGNEQVRFLKNEKGFSRGIYDISYKHKVRAVRSKNAFVTFEAILLHRQNRECVVMEMKMLEWFAFKINPIKDNFFRKENYYYPDTAGIFINVLLRLLPFYNQDEWEHSSGFQGYDGLQAVRKLLGMYNELRTEQERSNQRRADSFKTFCKGAKDIELTTCYWTAKHPEIFGNYIGRMLRAEERMFYEFAFFREQMKPIGELFRSGLGVVVNVNMIHYKELIDNVDLKPEMLAYLKRYDV